MNIIDVTNLFPIEGVWWRKVDSVARITDIAIHHTAGFYLSPTATQEEEINHLRMIHQYHISRGFGGIGYHIVVFPSGRVYKTCNYNRWGANVYLENDSVLGISAVGTFDTYIPQDIQLNGMCYGIIDFRDYTNKETICRPHRYWGGTACPGTRYLEWVPGLSDRTRSLKEDDEMTTETQMNELLSEMRELHKLRTEKAVKQTEELLSEMRELHKLTAEAQQSIINHQENAEQSDVVSIPKKGTFTGEVKYD